MILIEKTKTYGVILKQLVIMLFREFFAHNCQRSAAALTYMTLFAIIPLMTVVYSVFSIIPTFQGVSGQLESLIFSHFIPETGSEIQSYLSSFSSQARSLSGFGVGMLVVTAYLMLTNIEKTFNAIWGVSKGRRGLSSFLLYWAVLSIGPLLLGLGLAMNTYLLSIELFVSEHDALGLSKVLFRSLPICLSSAAFTLLFVAVPNCRVPLRYAILGGILTAFCFELLKDIFGIVVAHSSFHVVYGAFAVFPLFLLWINLAWVLVLAGAIFVRTLAERRYSIAEGEATDMVAALKCLELFYHRHQSGQTVSDYDCYSLGLGVVHWQTLRAKFIDREWISPTAGGRYVLCRDLRSLNLWDLAELVDLKLHNLELKIANPPSSPWFQRYLTLRESVVESTKESFNVSIEAVLTQG